MYDMHCATFNLMRSKVAVSSLLHETRHVEFVDACTYFLKLELDRMSEYSEIVRSYDITLDGRDLLTSKLARK